jgi:LysM repeat protein
MQPDTPRKMADNTANSKPKRPSVAQPRLRVPDVLQLPDGRQFNTRELLTRRTPSVLHNLRSANPKQPSRGRPASKKYFQADYEFMARATLEEIQQRYHVTPGYSHVMRSKSRQLLRQQGQDF